MFRNMLCHLVPLLNHLGFFCRGLRSPTLVAFRAGRKIPCCAMQIHGRPCGHTGAGAVACCRNPNISISRASASGTQIPDTGSENMLDLDTPDKAQVSTSQDCAREGCWLPEPTLESQPGHSSSSASASSSSSVSSLCLTDYTYLHMMTSSCPTSGLLHEATGLLRFRFSFSWLFSLLFRFCFRSEGEDLPGLPRVRRSRETSQQSHGQAQSQHRPSRRTCRTCRTCRCLCH